MLNRALTTYAVEEVGAIAGTGSHVQLKVLPPPKDKVLLPAKESQVVTTLLAIPLRVLRNQERLTSRHASQIAAATNATLCPRILKTSLQTSSLDASKQAHEFASSAMQVAQTG